MGFGLIVIGDEILSGRRVDKHFPKVVELLKARGLSLAWCEYLGDDPARIRATLARTYDSDDTVLCTGGIGATPDDYTRQCAAAAAEVSLVLHPEARIAIRERIAEQAELAGEAVEYDRADNLQRLKMGEFPVIADIIPNSFNRIPGFSVWHERIPGLSRRGAHHFAPGFPVMAWPMFEWVLDTYHADQFHRDQRVERSVFVSGAMESRLTPLMEAIERDFPTVRVFSLPHVADARFKNHIELGVKGIEPLLTAAFEKLILQLGQQGYRFTDIPPAIGI